jgi:hypothetical protein
MPYEGIITIETTRKNPWNRAKEVYLKSNICLSKERAWPLMD